jgi:hypothetical protein
MVTSLKDTHIFLGLGGAYRKFIPDFGVLAIPLNFLTTLLKPEFDSHLAIPENRLYITSAMDTMKAIVTVDLCLVLQIRALIILL